MLGVFVKHEGAEAGDEHHFVRVDHDAVGEVETVEQVVVALAENRRSAVCGVDMQPDFVLAADFCDFANRIKRADRRGASSSANGDDRDVAIS